MSDERGVVAGIFVGDGGVPKQPVLAAEVTAAGIVGDRQRMVKIHGRPWQALCLWSAEVVAALQDEGHPVFAGACGENLSISGIEWRDLAPGARLRIGGVMAELSEPTAPCRQIRPYFAAAKVRRIDHDRYPGSARWYARVLQAGCISVGDPVVLGAAVAVRGGLGRAR